MSMHYAYNTPFGKVTIVSDGMAITRLVFGSPQLEGTRAPNGIMNTAATQLQEYLAGHRRMFDLPLQLEGTAFQNDVWRAIELIPYGETRTYSQIAASIGRPGSARAVGSAANANPIPIIVPCHRVVPASGGIGGYAYGESVKRFLLNLERENA